MGLEVNINQIASGAQGIVDAVSSNQIIASMIWGGAGLFLFLFPYFYYMKRFYFQNQQDGKSYFEVFVTSLSIQIVIMAVLSTGAFFSNQMDASGTDYDAKTGIRLFYTGNASNLGSSLIYNAANYKLWELWKPLESDTSEGFTVSDEEALSTGTAILIYYMSIVLYFTLIAITAAITFFPIMHFTRKSQDDRNNMSVMNKIGSSFGILLGIMVITWLHQAIASSYVEVFGGIEDFSFLTMSQAIWKEILL